MNPFTPPTPHRTQVQPRFDADVAAWHRRGRAARHPDAARFLLSALGEANLTRKWAEEGLKRNGK